MSALVVRGLTKTFRSHLRGGAESVVLRDLDLDLPEGSCTAVTGPSGSGKSSILRCIYRTYLPDTGSIRLHVGGGVVDLAAADDRTVLTTRRERLGLVTQFLHVIPRRSAVDLVAAEGVDRGEAAERLRRLGLADDRLESPPATFSGGERQMVGVAIALARPRPVLLLDEPTASLDPARRDRALQEVLRRKRAGATLLAVFHEVPALPGLVDRVLTLRDGRLVAA